MQPDPTTQIRAYKQSNPGPCMLARKPRRRRDGNLRNYVQQARSKIARHMTEFIEMQAQGDIKSASRVKNIIAAYESRIGKQYTLVKMEKSVSVREQ